MRTEDMIRMANQIAVAFATEPHDQAVKDIVNHIEHFWEPRMRDQLRQHVASGGQGLSPLSTEAARSL